jgi:signal transduction histidine kinase
LFIGAITIFAMGFYPGRCGIIFISNSAVLITLVLLNYFFPGSRLNTYQNDAERVIDIIISYLIISSSITFVLSTIFKNYNKARRTIIAQNSELENFNDNLNRMNEELILSNASKDKLLSIIAHDLRSPLGTLVNYSDLLFENYGSMDQKKIKEILYAINIKQKKTLILLEDLLSWSKSQTGTMSLKQEKIDLRTTLQSVIENENELAISKNIKIDNNIGNEVILLADRNMLKTILRNILSNGLKFTSSGGNISITSDQRNNFEVIMIKDSGIGMTAETTEMLWEIKSWENSDTTIYESGSGLGLTLCKDFVEMHGGEIWVESEYGNGSKFYFTIPRLN